MNKHDRFLTMVMAITGMREQNCDIIFKDESVSDNYLLIEAFDVDTKESIFYRYYYNGDFEELSTVNIRYREDSMMDLELIELTELEEQMAVNSGCKKNRKSSDKLITEWKEDLNQLKAYMKMCRLCKAGSRSDGERKYWSREIADIIEEIELLTEKLRRLEAIK